MITLQTLEWGYLFSYGDNNKIDFTENTVTQILGINGNGKSSIALILEEVIFNKNSKGIKKADVPNRYADKGYWIKLRFEKDGDEYLIEADRKTTMKLKLWKNGADISSHTASNTLKVVEELFGNDFKTFSQLVYQNTTNSLQFLTATDTNRKKFLIELLQLEDYVILFELFKDAVKDHASVVSNIEGQISTIEKWIANNKVEDTEEKPLLPFNDIDLTNEEREYAELGQSIQGIDRKNKSISANNQYKALLAAINIDEINAIETEEIRSYDSEQAELGSINARINRNLAEIRKLENLADVCPTCEQPIEESFRTGLIDSEKRELDEARARLEEITTLIDTIKLNNSNHKYKQEKVAEWQQLFGSIDKTLPSEALDKKSLLEEQSNLAIRISNAREKLRTVTQHNQEITKHNSRIAVFKEQADKFEKELAEASVKLSGERDNLGNLEILKKAFSTNGLIAYKIENLVKDLEELTNEYLAELSDGRFTIEFIVVSDKLNVNITDNGNVIDIVALSSGELARVNTSTLLALRKLMSGISKSRINVLFLDEVISVLDDDGREKLVEVLLKEELNTFIVSHSWSHPLLAKLTVVKEDEMSRIE